MFDRRRVFIPSLFLALLCLPPPDSTAQTSFGENIILGRPTGESVVVHVLAEEGTGVYAEFGRMSERLTGRTDPLESSADGTAAIAIDGLDANTAYYYRVVYEGPEGRQFGNEHSFRTRPPGGETFSFGVQGDSHPERIGLMYSPDLYVRTLDLVADARPDLYFMLGDDFSISNQLPNYFQGDRSVLTQQFVDDVYIDQRRFLGRMSHSTALFPVNGNHEEARRSLLGTVMHDVAIFAGRARSRYFPVPFPDDFYSGNPEPVDGIGLLGDYFAFEWGDALFIALDPYWHSTRVTSPIGGMGAGTGTSPPWSEIVDQWNALTRSTGDMWDSTIGDAQYSWLKTTLEESGARYKFVFMHHVLGTGRGGIELATQYEWGGYNDAGEWEFDERRPGWELPLHPLMRENGVTIVFQAHDHLFARQELDGIVYQSVPNPADDLYNAHNREAYLSGDILPNSGYLNVTVSPEQVVVDYIRSYLPEHEVDGARHGETAYTYILPVR